MEDASADFPVVCETCLGKNPFMRMSRQPQGKECKICQRPFTVHRWTPGPRLRPRRTEICQTCCKLKNICSVCALDLTVKMPVRARDFAVGRMTDPIARQPINKEYFIRNAEDDLAAGLDSSSSAYLAGLGPLTRHEIAQLAESKPYKRMIGESVDGDTNITESGGSRSRKPPNTSKTLFVNGISKETTKEQLDEYFNVWGQLEKLAVFPEKRCALVTFDNRRSAENANIASKSGFQLNNRLCVTQFAVKKNDNNSSEIVSDSPPHVVKKQKPEPTSTTDPKDES